MEKYCTVNHKDNLEGIKWIDYPKITFLTFKALFTYEHML